jgi:uncharacterized protein (DUF779 family)
MIRATVTVSGRATEILRRVRETAAGPLTISIDSGCCEGTAPHLYDNYVVPHGSVEIARAADIPVFIPPHFQDQYDGVRFEIDAVDDENSDAMSLETRLGVRLVMRHVGARAD